MNLDLKIAFLYYFHYYSFYPQTKMSLYCAIKLFFYMQNLDFFIFSVQYRQNQEFLCFFFKVPLRNKYMQFFLFHLKMFTLTILSKVRIFKVLKLNKLIIFIKKLVLKLTSINYIFIFIFHCIKNLILKLHFSMLKTIKNLNFYF